jgi:hypothetical protein
MLKKQTLPNDLLWSCIAVKVGPSVQPAPFDGTLDAIMDPWTPGTTSLEAKMKPGDELWIWSTGDGTCETLVERGGYAVVRHGKVIDHLNVWMS